MAILSFADHATEVFFQIGKTGKGIGWANVASVAKRKLDMVHYAARLDDLRSPPQNRLEALSGNLKGLHSIRINDQWRVVFEWTGAGPQKVRICDYH